VLFVPCSSLFCSSLFVFFVFFVFFAFFVLAVGPCSVADKLQ
jgi:hypothetical protein